MTTNSRHLLHSFGMGLIGFGVLILVADFAGWDVPPHIFAVAFLLAFGATLAAPMALAFPVEAAEAFQRGAGFYLGGRKMLSEAKAVGMGTVASEPPVTPATIDNEQPHRAAWQAYWIAGLEYAEEAGGITFSKMGPFVGDSHQTWRDCMVMPLVRAGYIAPVMPRRETTFEVGWNAAKARWRIEAGTLPPCPAYAPPVKFEALAGQGIAETV